MNFQLQFLQTPHENHPAFHLLFTFCNSLPAPHDLVPLQTSIHHRSANRRNTSSTRFKRGVTPNLELGEGPGLQFRVGLARQARRGRVLGFCSMVNAMARYCDILLQIAGRAFVAEVPFAVLSWQGEFAGVGKMPARTGRIGKAQGTGISGKELFGQFT
jgi:hypothetical protein